MDTKAPLSLTPNAIRRVAGLLAQEADDSIFRIAVLGGGCSGFRYAFDIEPGMNDDDEIFTFSGVSVVVDRQSLPFLMGSTLDYVEELIASRFQLDNPNARSSCGCGVSFSV